MAADDPLPTRDFGNVEVCKVGVWHPFIGPPDWVVTEDYLARLVANTRAAVRKIPLKIGHNFEQTLLVGDGLPDAGRFDPSSLRVEGESLRADLSLVPGKIAAVIEAGNWNAFSIETSYVDLPDGNVGEAITAVALLGADLPAVSSLDDIVERYARARLAAPQHLVSAARGTSTFGGTKPHAGLIVRAGRAPTQPVTGDPTVTDQPKPLNEDSLVAKIVAGLKSVFTPAPAIEPGKQPDHGPAIAAAQAEATRAVAAAKAANDELAAIKAAGATRDAEGRVEALVKAGKITPAQAKADGESGKALRAFALSNAAGFDAVWAAQPKLPVPLGAPQAIAGAADLSAFEPSDEAVKIAASVHGMTPHKAREMLRNHAARKAGVELPVPESNGKKS